MPEAFDMRLIQRGARLRRSPFFEATLHYGCRAYTIYNHMFLPSYYDDPVNEYWHLLNEVTLWDVSVERNTEITGPDALRFTSLLTPRDLSKCRVGQGKYVLITTEDGGIVNDPVLLRLGEQHFWLAGADSDLLLYAKGLAVHSGMQVTIREPDVSPLQVQGPKSKQVMQALFGDKVLALRYYYFLETDLDGIPVVVTRTGWTSEVGYEVYLRDGSRGDELWERIMRAGRPFNIRPTGPSDIRRIEGGILNHGVDMTLDTNPYELGLDRLVDLDKDTEFLGREALRRVRAEGVKRRLVGVEIAGAPIEFNMTRWPVRKGGETVGRVTSAIYSPRLKENIGYSMVPVALAALGTELEVETPAGAVRAVVVPMPFVDPGKTIPKS
ncbi:MAG TPA: glycine cleavage T C-terminal barrel domain-containing protein [Bryobacteraceae bacterium]|nr:glycine cleavage T C-terminal barrel domain-containing protein [Bryobacteraceae bacterium]